MVFDVTRPSTLEYNAVRWKNDFDTKFVRDDGNPAPCLLLGNKVIRNVSMHGSFFDFCLWQCDLDKDVIIKDQSFMSEFVEKNHFLRWFETSAKMNTNISAAMMYLIDEVGLRKWSQSK